MSDKYITTDNLSTFKSLMDNEIDEKISQAAGGPVVTFVDWTPTSYTVQVSFTNGSSPSAWQSTKIYKDYAIVSNVIMVSSANEIGSIATADGSTTVTTNTGKLLIAAKTSGMIVYNMSTNPTISNTMQIDGYSCDCGGSTSRGGIFENCYVIQVDDETPTYTNKIAYALTVTGDGSFNINQVEWND